MGIQLYGGLQAHSLLAGSAGSFSADSFMTPVRSYSMRSGAFPTVGAVLTSTGPSVLSSPDRLFFCTRIDRALNRLLSIGNTATPGKASPGSVPDFEVDPTTNDLYCHGVHVSDLMDGSGARSTGKCYFLTFEETASRDTLLLHQ